MDAKALFQEIAEGDIRPLYWFHGEEEFAKDRALEALIQTLPEGLRDFNIDLLESPDTQRILESARSLPMMAERRIVVARDPRCLSVESESKAFLEMRALLPSCNVIVLFQRGKADARRAFYKSINKEEAVVLFDPYNENEAAGWLVSQAKKSDVSLQRSDALALISMLGVDLSTLSDALQKLIDYAGDGKKIDRKMIEQSVNPKLEYTVFSMLEQFLSGHLDRAFLELRAALQEEGTGAAIQLTGFFASRLRAMLLAARALAAGRSSQQVIKDVGGNAYAAKKTVEAAKKMSVKSLEAALLCLAEADYASKHGANAEDALCDALLKIFALPAYEKAAQSKGKR